MKIITLNTWGGRAGKKELLSFFDKNKADVFCLQEIWKAPYDNLDGGLVGGSSLDQDKILVYGVKEISEVLNNYLSFFRSHHGDNYGLMTLVKNDIEISEEGEIFVYKFKGFVPEGDIGNHARNIQYTKLLNNNLTIINFHGLWNGKGKGDSDDRIEQSKKIIEFIKSLDTEVVLCGDFNLLPETESIKIIEDAGLRNLIKENNIQSTRTSFYTKPDKHADYIFVSSGVKVLDFKVLPDEVSDHSALYLEIE